MKKIEKIENCKFLTMRYKGGNGLKPSIGVMFAENKPLSFREKFDPIRDSLWLKMWLEEDKIGKNILLLREIGFRIHSDEYFFEFVHALKRDGFRKERVKKTIRFFSNDQFDYFNLFTLHYRPKMYNGKKTMELDKWIKTGIASKNESELNFHRKKLLKEREGINNANKNNIKRLPVRNSSL